MGALASKPPPRGTAAGGTPPDAAGGDNRRDGDDALGHRDKRPRVEPPVVHAVTVMDSAVLVPAVSSDSPPQVEAPGSPSSVNSRGSNECGRINSINSINKNNGSSSGGLICLNVRGTKLTVPFASLLEIPWFEALLTRWDRADMAAAGGGPTRDGAGNLYIDDDPDLFRALLYHARNVGRPTPLALDLTTPAFADNEKEQEFRLMVDQYGLTDVFYSFQWYQAEWVCSERAARCEITALRGDDPPRLAVPFPLDRLPRDKAHVIRAGTRHRRRIAAFELRIGDAGRLDWLDIGWMSECRRKTYKVRLYRRLEDPDSGRRSIKFACMEEDLDSVGETRTDSDSVELPLAEGAGATLLRLERRRLVFSVNGVLCWSAGATPATDLVPWIYHSDDEGAAIEVTRLELDH